MDAQIFKHKSKFQNPPHQNYKHVKTLEDILFTGSNAKNDSIFSIILFIGDSTFKTKMPENVRFARGGIEYIKSKTDIVFNAQEVTSVIEQIESGRLERFKKYPNDFSVVNVFTKSQPYLLVYNLKYYA